MRKINKIYIDGSFITPHGNEQFDLYNPAIATIIGHVQLADAVDARHAITAAKKAFQIFSHTTKAERISMLRRLHEAVMAKVNDLTDVTIEEYGAPISRASWGAKYAAESFLNAATTLEEYSFTRRVGTAEVVMEPVGGAGLITPWNPNAGFTCGTKE